MLSPTIPGLPQRACLEHRQPGGPLPCPPESDTPTPGQRAGINAPDAAHWPQGHACRATSREA
jgi:hypothetical protein